MKTFSFLVMVGSLAFNLSGYAETGTREEVGFEGLKINSIRSREVGQEEVEKPLYHVIRATYAVRSNQSVQDVTLGIFEKNFPGKIEQFRLLNLCLRRMEALNPQDRINLVGEAIRQRLSNETRLDLVKISSCDVVKATR
ncbi:MAG: hypothetical protein ACKN9V_10120 [Pseudomonadota bacterium]